MDRVNGADWVDIGDGKRGFRGRNALAGVQGTEVTADWLNGVQEELLAVVEAAGLDASGSDHEQVLKAIRSLRLNHVPATLAGSALTVTLDPPPASYDDLRVVWVVPNATSPAGALTVNINGLGAVALTVDGAAPPAAALKTGVPAMLVRAGAGFALVGSSAASGRLVRTSIYTRIGATQYIQVDSSAFTTVGASTFAPHAEATIVDIPHVQGGGGGGSGCPATDVSTQSAAGGGGSGAWACKRTTPAAVSGATITVGAAGAGGAAGSNVGGNGGTSSVGSLVSALGGSGGSPAGPIGTGNFIAVGGAGGVAGTSGDLNLPGLPGAAGVVAGGQGVPIPAAPGRALGGYYGSGGVSNSSSTSTAAKAGFAGIPGIIVIQEFA